MNSMANRQLRWAYEDRTKAEKAQKDHAAGCIACQRARYHRKPDQRCKQGKELAERVTEARRRVREEKKLAEQPMAGETALF